MSREAWVIVCTKDELQTAKVIVATKENVFYIFAAKPLDYFLRDKARLVHALGKQIKLSIVGYKQEASDGKMFPFSKHVERPTFKDRYGDTITYVRAGDVKPGLEDFNQDCDRHAVKHIQGLPDDTLLVLYWE